MKFDYTLHHGHSLLHATYFGAVAVEAHGYYGKIAACLLALTVIQLVRTLCTAHNERRARDVEAVRAKEKEQSDA